MIETHQCNLSPGHVDAVKNVIKYLKGTAYFSSSFHSNVDSALASFVHFKINKSYLVSINVAEWGPQD